MQSSCYAALQLNPEWGSTVNHTSASPFPLSSKHHLEPLCYQCLLPCPSSPSASLITSSNWLQLLSRAEWNHACTPPWWLCLPQLTENTWRTYKFEVLKKGAFFLLFRKLSNKIFLQVFPCCHRLRESSVPWDTALTTAVLWGKTAWLHTKPQSSQSKAMPLLGARYFKLTPRCCWLRQLCVMSVCLLLRAVAEELLKGQNTNKFCSIQSETLTKPPSAQTQV